ncbi:MAG: tRNA (adenosine(37)-N6)-threonylcarbamoyltransferase complex dimerization subunit type 1 TsaB [Chitinophagales bacterium]|nr:tRNA (adenosine(37)-N6)-threonylcarbamoyltransferase complex dimerization subunit type 1 TsaB [Chitinophagales bacterium]
MPIILNIETSTDVCSVAVAVDGNTIMLQESKVSNSHTEKLTLLIEACLREAGIQKHQLDAIAVCDGPGSYTSLRIGAATAKAMCYALDKPLITVDSLTILAYGVPEALLGDNNIAIAMIDARRNEVYAGVYGKSYEVLLPKAPVILDENPFETFYDGRHIYICGNGAVKYYQQYGDSNTHIQHECTSARYMEVVTSQAFEENQFASVAYFTPDYIKAPNITKSTKNLF